MRVAFEQSSAGRRGLCGSSRDVKRNAMMALAEVGTPPAIGGLNGSRKLHKRHAVFPGGLHDLLTARLGIALASEVASLSSPPSSTANVVEVKVGAPDWCWGTATVRAAAAMAATRLEDVRKSCSTAASFRLPRVATSGNRGAV